MSNTPKGAFPISTNAKYTNFFEIQPHNLM